MTARRTLRTLAGVLAGIVACNEATAPEAPVVFAPDARRLFAGEGVACALADAGKVHCWGGNSMYWDYGVAQVINPGTVGPSVADVPALARLATGVGTHYCGMRMDSTAVCWGRNSFAELGRLPAQTGAGAAAVAGGIKFADISVGRITTCGRTAAGAGYCWGYNQFGEIGNANVDIRDTTAVPSPVEGGHSFISIAAGWLHACGVDTDGKAWCWGNNTSGQLGLGTVDSVPHRSPEMVAGGITFKKVTLGSRHTCGLTADSVAYCWGENATGQLGDGTVNFRVVPTQVGGGHKFIDIVTSSGFGAGSYALIPSSPLPAGIGHTCALTVAKQPYCWGWNGNGQVGDGTTTDRTLPTPVAGSLTLTTIATGGAYTCGMNGSDIWCWGSNLNAQVGRGFDFSPVLEPRPVLPPFGTP
jgi:alpha-tubulin suppressor-like RCC1 family protein